MKIVQITDTHLVPPGQRLHGLDPQSRLEACVADICENHADAELCIHTGDLAHKGEIASYRLLRECLSGLPIPIHYMVGNHDDRDNLRKVFPEVASDDAGFIQTALDVTAGRLILLDTMEQHEKYGTFCDGRAAWLKAQLETCENRPAFLFMHHPPFKIGIPSTDRIRLTRGAELFAETITPFSNIRHIFLGHTHRPVAGSWRDIPISMFRGTNHQVPFDLVHELPMPRSHEPPAYGVIFLNSDSVIIHYHDFMDETAFFA